MSINNKKITLVLIISFSLIFLFLSFQTALASEIKIAVLPVDEGNINWYGWNEDEIISGITEKITNEMVNKKGINVIERSELEAVIDEQNFGHSGRIDSSTASKIGELLGVDYLLTSTVTQMQVEESGGISVGPLSVNSLKAFVNITGRVVNTQTAEIVDSASGKSKKKESSLSIDELKGVSFGSKAFSESVLGKSIDEAVALLVDSVEIDKLNPSSRNYNNIKVVKILGEKLIINAGSSAGISEGDNGEIIRLVEVEGLDEAVKMPVGEIRVYSVNNKNSAIVRIVDIESGESVQKGDMIKF